jgi:hypothetical protein
MVVEQHLEVLSAVLGFWLSVNGFALGTWNL